MRLWQDVFQKAGEMMERQRKKDIMIDSLFILFIGIVVYALFKWAIFYIFPFIVGMFAAMLVQKPGETLSKRLRIPKGLCTAVLVIVLYAVIVVVLAMLVNGIYRWVMGLIKAMPEVSTMVTAASDTVGSKLAQLADRMPDGAYESMRGALDSAIKNAGSRATEILTKVAQSIVTGLPSILLSVIITVIASVYVAKDYGMVVRFIGNQLSARTRDIVISAKQILIKNIFKMVGGYLILMMITFAELSVVLLILGQKNPFITAAAIAVIDILPVLGTGTVVIPWAIIRFIMGDFVGGIILLAGYAVITVVRNILEPRIIGAQVGIQPLVMLLLMFVGLKLFGLLGMIGLVLLVVIAIKLQENGKIHLWKRPQDLRKTSPAGAESPEPAAPDTAD